MTIIQHELAQWKALRDRLKAQYPHLEDDDLVDTLDGATTLREAIEALVTQAIETETLAAALRERIERMTERRMRLLLRSERIRAVVTAAMEESGLRRVETAEFTASLSRRAPGLIVTDEDAIPADYWRPQPAKLDKARLRAALRDGASVPGAALDNGGVALTVRRS